MTYQEALQQGAAAEGTIKCTYAILYDEEMNKLFSIQRTLPHKWKDKLLDESGRFIGINEDGLTVITDTTKYADLGLVYVDGAPKDEKIVPCKITDTAYVYLTNLITSKEKSASAASQLGLQYQMGSQYKKLLDLLKKSALDGKAYFYVNKEAFDWHITRKTSKSGSDKSIIAAGLALLLAVTSDM